MIEKKSVFSVCFAREKRSNDEKKMVIAALLALGFCLLLTGCIDANIVGKTYKVTFISEGEEYDSADAALGSRVVFPETPPTKEDDETYTYTFKGWSLTEGEDAKPVESHIVVGDVTFYAVFSREEKTPKTYISACLSKTASRAKRSAKIRKSKRVKTQLCLRRPNIRDILSRNGINRTRALRARRS